MTVTPKVNPTIKKPSKPKDYSANVFVPENIDENILIPVENIPVQENPVENFYEESFSRKEILKAINAQGLLTYRFKTSRANSYVKSAFALANFLMMNNLDFDAVENLKLSAVDLIFEYITNLKDRDEYEDLVRQAKEFKMFAEIFDVYGGAVKHSSSRNIFSTTESDIDRQFDFAETKLNREGIGFAYVKKFCKDFYSEDANDYKIDVIIFASNNFCIERLEKFAKKNLS